MILMILAFILLFVTSCSGSWYGTGVVTDKTHRGAYISYCGKSCFYTVPECYRLTVREYNGDEHTGCVRAKVWEDTAVGRSIVLTKETAS
ncbi:hypothetical protein PBI_EGAD_66 [Arthrobacter phage Egad]|nr:hypothetical protein PBI_EGAD_66 [Arthrobacter phage Egad]